VARLGRTCRALNRAITPILYQEVDDRAFPTGPTIRPAALALGLVAYPNNGNYIRSIKLFRQAGGLFALSEAAKIQTLQRTVQHLFGLKPDHNALDAPIAIMAIASLAPNLATLEITAADHWRNTDFMVGKTALGKVTGPRQTCTLHILTQLTVHYPDTASAGAPRNVSQAGGISITKLRGLLPSAPNLQSLTIETPRGGTALTARLENLTTLRLIHSYLCHRGLKQLVRACTKLVHFEYKQTEQPWRESYLPVCPAQALECLAPCRSTLQRLHIAIRMPDVQSRSRREEFRRRPYPLLTTLEGFSALKQVAVDYRAIERPVRDGEALTGLLWDCPALEGVFLMGVKEFPAKEFECFSRGVVESVQWYVRARHPLSQAAVHQAVFETRLAEREG
jgi:hypothetical protein